MTNHGIFGIVIPRKKKKFVKSCAKSVMNFTGQIFSISFGATEICNEMTTDRSGIVSLRFSTSGTRGEPSQAVRSQRWAKWIGFVHSWGYTKIY